MDKLKLIIIISIITLFTMFGACVGVYFIFKPDDAPETKVYYYSSLSEALGSIGDSNQNNPSLSTDKENADVAVNVLNGETTISFLKNLELSETLQIGKDVTIDLNGKEMVSTSDIAFKIDGANVVIKGSKDGGKVSVSSTDGQATILHMTSGTCKINGGIFETASAGVATTENPNVSILCESGTLDIENASITAKDSDDGVLHGVSYKSGATGSIKNSTVVVDSPYGLDSLGVKNEGNLVLTGCVINAFANYTANEAHTAYASSSRAVFNTGTLTLKNCTVYGAHSGVTSKGALYIDGGLYQGYGHGGIYLSAESKTSYIKNATFTDCEMKNNYIDDGIAGTNKAGAYIGGASNVNLYIDNCEFSGYFYPFVMRSSGGESNISVYISNSNIDFDREGFRYIRVDAKDSANQKLYIGSGNNFTTENGVYKETNAEATDIDYSSMFPVY